MYLHIGNGKTVRLENIVGIFDLDNATVSGISKRFITEAQKRGEVEYDYADLPRGFVLTDEGKKKVRLKRKERYKIKAKKRRDKLNRRHSRFA